MKHIDRAAGIAARDHGLVGPTPPDAFPGDGVRRTVGTSEIVGRDIMGAK